MTDQDTNIIRILAVDDEEEVLETYQEILGSSEVEDFFLEIDTKAGKLFSDYISTEKESIFELVTCQQGDEAVELVKVALEQEKPFAVALIDVRMPPGPDGAWTAQQIHSLDPCMNIVIVTAYSDVSPAQIAKNFQIPARLFYIKKPFHWDEIRQFTDALSENWKIHHELMHTSDSLQELVENHVNALKVAQQDAAEAKEELLSQTQKVEEVNTALRVILNEKEWEKKRYEENLVFNFNQNVAPYLLQLQKTDLTAEQKGIVATIEENLKFMKDSLSSEPVAKRLRLSPVELEVANLIKHGRPTKEIAEMLNLSPLTIESYRKAIRKKIGLTHSKENLRTWLLEYL